jgi:hypothetical protein
MATDPIALLQAVHAELVPLAPDVAALQKQPDDRKVLGDAVAAATEVSAMGSYLGARAASAVLAAVADVALKYAAAAGHPHAAKVAKAVPKALADAQAAEAAWAPPPPPPSPPPPVKPVMSVQPLAAVRVDKAAPVNVHAPVSLDRDAPEDAEADFVVTGLSPEFFVGGAIPAGKVKVAKGAKAGGVPFQLTPQADTPWHRAKAEFRISSPVNAVLGTAAASFDVIGHDDPPPPPPPPGTNPSGLPWRSGVTVPSNLADMVGDVRKFGANRGRKVDIVNVKSLGTAGWSELVNAVAHKGPVYQALADDGMAVTQVIDYIPRQPGISGNVLQQAGAGAFDKYWQQIGQMLRAYPKAGGFYAIRAGHELNGTFAWGPTADPDQKTFANYKASFARFSGIMQEQIPGVQIDWCWLRRGRPYRWDDVFPGARYVHIAGLDPYDNEGQGPLADDAAFQRYAFLKDASGIPHGPGAALEWAVAHGLKAGFAEWGLSTGGDDPVFMRGMFGLFKKYAASLAYEVYFNIQAEKDHRLFDSNPNATAEYKRTWTAG